MGVFSAALAALLVKAGDETRDWGATLRTDATALHHAIATSHPGPVNPADPGFAARNDAQLARALARSRTADSFAHYFYAMQEYAASFDDGHLSFGVVGATPDEIRRWPGFLTQYTGTGEQEVFVSQPWSGVPLGARLASCDGLSADEVAYARVGSRFGRWRLASQRRLLGAMSFLDTGNPYVASVKRCRFRHHGRTAELALRWRAPDENLYERYVFGARRNAEVGRERLADGTHWFTIPSFNGDPDSPTSKALQALISSLNENAKEVRAAPAVVFDLRGNGGGSSEAARTPRARPDLRRHGRGLHVRLPRRRRPLDPPGGDHPGAGNGRGHALYGHSSRADAERSRLRLAADESLCRPHSGEQRAGPPTSPVQRRHGRHGRAPALDTRAYQADP